MDPASKGGVARDAIREPPSALCRWIYRRVAPLGESQCAPTWWVVSHRCVECARRSQASVTPGHHLGWILQRMTVPFQGRAAACATTGSWLLFATIQGLDEV